MRALLVLAHPEPASFNAALHRTAAATLVAQGHEIVESDLYAMGWKAVADPADFAASRDDADVFRLDREQWAAHHAGTTAPDIAAEQEKVAWADVLVLQFPLWWFGPPAILKGWFDRVLTRGFAYSSGRKHDTGLLAGRTALVSVTTGTVESTYASDGIDGALIDVLWPVTNGVLRYCGMEVWAPIAVHAPGRMDDGERALALDRHARVIETLGERERLFFHPLSDYGDDERLLPGVQPRSGFQRRT